MNGLRRLNSAIAFGVGIALALLVLGLVRTAVVLVFAALVSLETLRALAAAREDRP